MARRRPIRFVLTLLVLMGMLCASDAVFAQNAPLRVLAYGDSNTWGLKPNPGGGATRYSDHERWAGVLQRSLGDNATVVVDGLVGRTTNIDRKEDLGIVPREAFNGVRGLPAAIARNLPLDAVVIMLGVNDIQASVGRSPSEVASAIIELAETARKSKELLYSTYPAPRVLVVAPPPVGDTSRTALANAFKAAEQPSRKLAAAYAEATGKADVAYFDAGIAVAEASSVDGVHLSAQDHQALGVALAPHVRRLAEGFAR